MKYKNNHAANLRGNQNYNRKQVLYLTGLTEQQLTEMQMFLLSEWLSYFHPVHTPDEWLCSEGLWNWWMYMWNDMDEDILPVLYAMAHIPANRHAQYRVHLQQIFNKTYNPKAQQIMADFKSLAPDFITELKKNTGPFISTAAQGHPYPLEKGRG